MGSFHVAQYGSGMSRKKSPIIGILSMKTWEDQDKIFLRAYCVLKMQGSSQPLDTDRIRIDTAAVENAAEIRFGSRYGRKLPKGYRLNTFELAVDRSIANKLDIQNKLIVRYDGSAELKRAPDGVPDASGNNADHCEGRILYSMYDLKKGRNRNTEVFVRDGIAMYFRQSKYNSLTLTVRDANIYDTPEGQRRIEEAYRRAAAARRRRPDKSAARPGRAGSGIAKGVHGSGGPILMYEKNCARYEESASVLYERLIDAGYDNVYYVVNEDNPAIQELPERYRRNLVWKDSDRHLELIFESDTYIATESTEHALQLRIASKRVMDKIKSNKLRYVFLQHGVMYMVSLNSELRTGFHSSDLALQRTVVSSEAEAQHFIQLADMKREELYITGLAKFDKCYRNDGADRIVIMLTWRRWETNQARDDLEGTKYYKMISRIFEAVPDELRDRVVILPHPLMADRFREAEDIGGHVLLADSYDKVLRDCDLLITDYSSIAYDAFYRGANVIFCWDEKDECMQHYGEGTFLMLNEDNVFGDVCMSSREIREAVQRNYGRAQSADNITRYRKIVEFHDGRNSDRIIEHLKQDGLI